MIKEEKVDTILCQIDLISYIICGGITIFLSPVILVIFTKLYMINYPFCSNGLVNSVKHILIYILCILFFILIVLSNLILAYLLIRDNLLELGMLS